MKHDRNCQKEQETGNRGYYKKGGGGERARTNNRKLILKSRLEIFLSNLLEVSQRGDRSNVGTSLGRVFRSGYLIAMVLSRLINLEDTCKKAEVNINHQTKV